LLDGALAAALINVDERALTTDMNPRPAGMLVEGFVFSELRKQIGWSQSVPQMFHFRDRNGPEVDVIMEASDGRVVAVEVKASATLGRGDFRWLEMLRDRLAQRFVVGVVLYLGTASHVWGDRLAGLPLGTLWRT
jgi:predicted AAA+ superfamily ATPase